MNITKVIKVTTSDIAESPKSFVIVYDTGIQFSFCETDEDKERNQAKWDEIQAWVAKGNTIEIVDWI